MEADVRGVLSQFKTIVEFARNLRTSPSLIKPPKERVEALIAEYTNALQLFEMIRVKLHLETYLLYIESCGVETCPMSILQSIEIECKKAIGVLESIAIPLPKEDMDKLSSIREELKELSVKLPNVYFEKNIDEAIKEYEQRHFLASALISGRVLTYALDQISGKSIEEKIETLQEQGVIDKERKDLQEAVTKADKKARNFFSHDIRVTPSSSDALSLLGDTLKMLKYVTGIR